MVVNNLFSKVYFLNVTTHLSLVLLLPFSFTRETSLQRYLLDKCPLLFLEIFQSGLSLLCITLGYLGQTPTSPLGIVSLGLIWWQSMKLLSVVKESQHEHVLEPILVKFRLHGEVPSSNHNIWCIYTSCSSFNKLEALFLEFLETQNCLDWQCIDICGSF